jgi:hypothetical protein
MVNQSSLAVTVCVCREGVVRSLKYHVAGGLGAATLGAAGFTPAGGTGSAGDLAAPTGALPTDPGGGGKVAVAGAFAGVNGLAGALAGTVAAGTGAATLAAGTVAGGTGDLNRSVRNRRGERDERVRRRLRGNGGRRHWTGRRLGHGGGGNRRGHLRSGYSCWRSRLEKHGVKRRSKKKKT